MGRVLEASVVLAKDNASAVGDVVDEVVVSRI
jgi:hypothetical protein